MKVIDQFLIALGFKVDDESVKESEEAIDNIRTDALAMGAALSGAFVKAGLTAKRTAGEVTDVYNTSKLLGSVGVSQLDAYRHAFQQAGGAASDAESTLSGFEDLLAKATLGDGPFEELEKAGIPASLLTDTRTSIELFDKLAKIFPRLTDEQKKLASGALGLNRGADLLLRQGPDQIQAWMDEADRMGVITDTQSENMQEMIRMINKAERAWDDLMRKFTEKAAPGIAESIDDLAESLNKLDGLAERLGQLYGDNFDFLAPAAGAAAGASGLGVAGKAAQKMGFTKLGGKLATGARFLGTKVAGPLAAASFFNVDEDIAALTGRDPNDYESVAWMFRDLRDWNLLPESTMDHWIFKSPMQNLDDYVREHFGGLDLPFSSPSMPIMSLPPAPSPVDIDRDSLVPMTNTSTQSTYQDNRQYQFTIDGSGDPERTADVILERINQADEMARRQLQTARAG